MTQPPQPTERFAQHPRLAELVTALGFRRYPLFLTGLLHQEPGGALRLASAVASRDGDLVAYDAGEVVEHAGRVPTSRLFDDDPTGRQVPGQALDRGVDALRGAGVTDRGDDGCGLGESVPLRTATTHEEGDHEVPQPAQDELKRWCEGRTSWTRWRCPTAWRRRGRSGR